MTKPASAAEQEARRTLASWLSGAAPPPDLSRADALAWRDRERERIYRLALADPITWWTVALESFRGASQMILADFAHRLPFEMVLIAGGEPVQRLAAEVARNDPAIAALIFDALNLQSTLPGQPWGREAGVVSLLGLDLAVAAEARLLAAVHAAGGGEPGKPSAWDSVDFWASHLGSSLASRAPELGWDYVRGVIAAVPDELLYLVGAGELEDFCWRAADAYIERIEDEAAHDPRFRTALGHVWPGGETITAPTYARIRQAADLVSSPVAGDEQHRASHQ